MVEFTPQPSTEQIVEQLRRSLRLLEVRDQIDALIQEEQERRQRFYEEVSEEQKKVEFINGEIVVQGSARHRHGQASLRMATLLTAHVDRNDLGIVGHESYLVTLTRNDYLPDVCFFGLEKAVQIKPDQFKFPAPDLVIEVLSDSTEHIDRGLKFEDYALHGVAEYWILDAEEESIEQYLLHEGKYALSVKVKTGMIQSEVVRGFEIPVRAVFDAAQYNEALRRIVA